MFLGIERTGRAALVVFLWAVRQLGEACERVDAAETGR